MRDLFSERYLRRSQNEIDRIINKQDNDLVDISTISEASRVMKNHIVYQF